jgi:hypothetical protein
MVTIIQHLQRIKDLLEQEPPDMVLLKNEVEVAMQVALKEQEQYSECRQSISNFKEAIKEFRE